MRKRILWRSEAEFSTNTARKALETITDPSEILALLTPDAHHQIASVIDSREEIFP